MPNLVGIGNSQVPTNAMLGGLAYQDSVGEIDIEKIKARTSDNAVDIFVYDTRKDSDGGAWRHRTQKTSWYNEVTGTHRGARKEFPAVAVLVVTDNSDSTPSTLVIYDGDDPNLPMWMKWERDTTQDPFLDYSTPGSHHLGNYEPTSVSALNGIICVGTFRSAGSLSNLNAGLREFHFIEDIAYATNNDKRVRFPTNIADRDVVTVDYKQVSPNAQLVDSNINDVAMTVLPNAPIDESTGLPRPTIAVATDGGTNVINNDGTITQGYQTIDTENVDLHPDGFMTDGISGATNDSFSLYDITKKDRLVSYGHRVDTQVINTFLNEGTGECLFEGKSNKIAIAQSQGLLRIAEEIDIERASDAVSLGLHNRTASSYNTGWMVADIKGAFMSDTDTTNVTGSELVTNGTFDSNISSWTYTGSGSATHSSGQIEITGAVGDKVYQDISGLTVGETYVLSGQIVSGSTGQISMYQNAHASSGAFIVGSGNIAPATINLVFTAPTTTVNLRLVRVTSTVVYDNISVRKAELDRSANGQPYQVGGVNYSIGQNALAVFGTVTKSAVATDAELVSYGPFSTSNRLRQPYNSDLNFETNDFSIMFWMYNTGTNDHETLVSRDDREFDVSILDNDTYSRRFRIYADNSSNSSNSFDSTDDPFPLNTWSHVCVNFIGGSACAVYVNGVLNKAGDLNYDIDDTSHGLNIGARFESGSYAHAADGTKLALVRISKSAPTPEQIKKIYNDEKCLYYDNAQATLYGTSDAVTALAHDDSNNILHVGTSAGRSEFQGLTRINNTTTAVTTAISASNEFVAEQ